MGLPVSSASQTGMRGAPGTAGALAQPLDTATSPCWLRSLAGPFPEWQVQLPPWPGMEFREVPVSSHLDLVCDRPPPKSMARDHSD